MATPFETFVNGELPKRVSTEAPPLSWTNGQVLTTTGVGLAVEAVDTNTLGFEPAITGSGVATEFWNGNKAFVSVTAEDLGAIPTSEKGAADGVATLDAGGLIPLSQIPAAAVERVVVVADETARFALTTATVQQGDVVDQQSPKAIYFVVDDAELDNAAGYSELVAGIAAAVAWSGVTGIPIIISDIASISGSVDGDILQKVSGIWVNRTTAQLKTSLAIETSDVSGLTTALDLKADLESPTFTGTITIPTAIAGDSSTAAANTAFVAGEISTNAQPKDATLTALAAYNTNGIVVQTAADTFAGRSLAAGQGITILNPSAVAANPTISITDTAVTPGTYGSAAKIPIFTADSAGRITSASEVDNGVFSDSVFRIQANGNATKQIAFEASAIATGTTKTITMPNQNVDLSKVPAALSYDPTTTILTQTTAGSPFTTSLAPVSTYTAAVAYSVGALVSYLGHTWRVIVAHTGAIPFVNGNLELISAVFCAGQQSGDYTAIQLGATSNPPVEKTLEIDLVGYAAQTINLDFAPRNVRINATGGVSTKAITLTRTGVTISGDAGEVLGTGTYTFNIVGGDSFYVYQFNTLTLLKLRKQHSVQRFKIIDATASGAGTGVNGWGFSGTASAPRTITLPNSNVNLGNIPTVLTYTPSTTTFSTGILSTSIAPISEYTGGVMYSVGALVYHQQHTWKVIVNHTGTIPFVNGSLELLGEVFKAFVRTTPYLAPRLGADSPDLGVVDKILEVTLYNNSATTVDISNAPGTIIIREAYMTGSKALTITKTHASLNVILLGDDGTALVTPALTVSYTFNLAAGAEVEILNFSSGAVIYLKKQNTIGRFKLNDVSSTLDAAKNNGWRFDGIATAARNVTMPDSDINFGRVTAYTNTATAITVTASPFTRTNPSAFADEDIIVEGGTVSLIQFSRNGSAWYNVGSVAGMYRLSPSDRLRVTYTVAPTMTGIPR